MAIDFPNSPSTNNTYTVGNKTWIYDGTTWNTYNSTTFSAETLPGTTIKSTVTGSSLTSVGTLGSLTVTNNVGAATFTGSPSAATTTTGASGIGYMGLPQNATTTGSYTIVAADAGKHIYSTATRTVTIPANVSVAMPVGSTIVFIAGTGATVTIAITSDTMYLAGPGTTGSRTLAPFGMATAVKIAINTWIISGNGLT